MANTNKSKERTEAGKNFSAAIKLAGIKPAAIAKLVGGYPQQVNNWKKRGVPARFAAVVAKKIGSKPEDISAEYVSEDSAAIHEPAQKYDVKHPEALDFSEFTAEELRMAVMMAMDELPIADKKILLRHLVDSF